MLLTNPEYLRNVFITCVLHNYYLCVCWLLPFEFDHDLLYTCLYAACVNNNHNMVAVLLNSQLSINDIRRKDNHILRITSRLGHASIVRLLFRRGLTIADAAADADFAIVNAVRYGHTETVLVFINYGLSLFDIQLLWTLAAQNGHVAILKLFLMHGLTPEHIVARYDTAIELATNNNHLSTVSYLMRIKAFVDYKHHLRLLLSTSDNVCSYIRIIVLSYCIIVIVCTIY